jgi:hypothetical protein
MKNKHTDHYELGKEVALDPHTHEEIREKALGRLARRRKDFDELCRDIVLSDKVTSEFLAGLKEQCCDGLRERRSSRVKWRTVASIAALLLIAFSVYLSLPDPVEPYVYTHSTSEPAPTVSPRKKLPYTLIKTERASKALTVIRTSDAPVMLTIKTQPKHLTIISDSELIESLTKNGAAIAMTRKNDRCRVYMFTPSGRLHELTGSSLIPD